MSVLTNRSSIRRRGAAVALLALCLGAMAQGDTVIPYSFPAAYIQKHASFSLTVNGIEVPVYQGTRPFAWFAFEGTAELRVSGVSSSYQISPKPFELTPTFSGSTMTFTIQRPRKLVIHNDYAQELLIFAEPLESGAPKRSDADVIVVTELGADSTGRQSATSVLQYALGEVSRSPSKRIVYVPRGVYNTSDLVIRDSTTLYLEPGAVLRRGAVAQPAAAPLLDTPASLKKTAYKIVTSGLIDFDHARGARLCGRGIIDNNNNGSSVVHTMGCFDIRVEDAMLTRTIGDNYTCFIRGSKNVQVRNLKVMNNH